MRDGVVSIGTPKGKPLSGRSSQKRIPARVSRCIATGQKGCPHCGIRLLAIGHCGGSIGPWNVYWRKMLSSRSWQGQIW